MKTIALALALALFACDPGDEAWDGRAPYAPDDGEASDEAAPPPGKASSGSAKHGAQGAWTVHTAQLQIQSGFTTDWCSGAPAVAGSCLKNRWQWYGVQWVDVNNTSRTRCVSQIDWSYGWQYMAGFYDFNDVDVIVCLNGVCPNVANQQSYDYLAGGALVRAGTTYAHQGQCWSAYGWGVFDAAIRLRSGVTTPARYPQLSINVKYVDGQ
jgi:hypothetical protein